MTDFIKFPNSAAKIALVLLFSLFTLLPQASQAFGPLWSTPKANKKCGISVSQDRDMARTNINEQHWMDKYQEATKSYWEAHDGIKAFSWLH